MKTRIALACAIGAIGSVAIPAASAQTLLLPISTPADFDLLRTMPGGSFYLTNDIDMTGVTFDPIGSVGTPFTGSLNGGGYVISNLTINECPEIQDLFDFMNTQDRIGFFGVTDGAALTAVVLEDVHIVGDETVGGLVAQAQDTSFKNCSVTGTVLGRIQVGGMAGFFGNSDAENCWTDATVGLCEPRIFPGKWHGGLIGHAHPFRFPGRDASNTGDGSDVINCYTRGTTSGVYVAGGVFGNFHGTFAENCFATGSVQTEHGFSGGFAGYIQNEPGIGKTPVPIASTIVDCHARGDVTSESFGSISELQSLGLWDFSIGLAPMPSGGGFVGYVEGGLNAEGTFPNVLIQDSSARGHTFTFELSPALNLPTAGFAGFTEIETFISFCKAIGDVTAENQTSSGGFVGWGEGVIEDSSSHGDVVAFNRSGGFGGQCAAIRNAVNGTPGPFGGKFRRCTSYGNFRATDASTGGALIGAGGFVGYLFEFVELEDCYSHGSVTSPGGWVGGFVGHVADNLFTRCASFGPVFTGERNAGGFAGRTRLAGGTDFFYCYSHSDVIYTGPGGASESNIGGFIGSGENIAGAHIHHCYSVGTVVADGSNVGGFVGQNSGPWLIHSCYYDTQTSHQSGTQPTGVTGETTANMRKQATYLLWDFFFTWDIVEDVTYPFHR